MLSASGQRRDMLGAMNLTLSIPDELAVTLKAQGRDLARSAMEALVAQGFREWQLSRAEVQDVLGLSWHETEAFLARHGCDRHYTEDDLAQDRQTLTDLFGR